MASRLDRLPSFESVQIIYVHEEGFVDLELPSSPMWWVHLCNCTLLRASHFVLCNMYLRIRADWIAINILGNSSFASMQKINKRVNFVSGSKEKIVPSVASY